MAARGGAGLDRERRQCGSSIGVAECIYDLGKRVKMIAIQRFGCRPLKIRIAHEALDHPAMDAVVMVSRERAVTELTSTAPQK